MPVCHIGEARALLVWTAKIKRKTKVAMKTNANIEVKDNKTNRIDPNKRIVIRGTELSIMLGDSVVITTNVKNYGYYYSLLKESQ